MRDFRKTRRWPKVLAAIGAGALLLAALVIAPTDSTPYAARAEYDRSVASLTDAIMAARLAEGPIAAGMGRASLTPSLGRDDWVAGGFASLPLAGYADRRGASATGVHDELFVRALALRVGGETLVFTSFDMLLVPGAVAEALARRLPELGLERRQLYLGATHTHSSFGGWDDRLAARFVAGRSQPAVVEWIERQAAASIREALADLRPATLRQGAVEAPDMIENSLSADGTPVNAIMPFIAVEQDGGRRAVLTSFGAHPTLVPASVRELSGDYPGFLAAALEADGFDMALFLAGAVGGHKATSEKGFDAARRYGEALAERLEPAIAAAPVLTDTQVGSAGSAVALPPLQVRFAAGWRVRPWLADMVLQLPDAIYQQSARVGSVVLAASPVDYSGELALRLRSAMSDRGLIASVTSFNGDYAGYIVPAAYDNSDSYEARDMAFFGAGAGEYLSEMLIRMAEALAQPKPADPAGEPQAQSGG